MKKSKLKANPVGANCIRQHFKEMTLKKEKGITLIALIITIIVMLILVGVTINVALNGGLFQKAETATVETEKQAIYEQIINNMELTNDGKISVKETFDNVIAEFGIDKVTNINPAVVDVNTKEVTFSIVGKTGTYSYKMSEKSVEKNTANKPKQEGSLVYGKAYSADGVLVIFSKEYNWVIRGINTSRFSYNEEENTVIMHDIGMTFTVSEDGNTISSFYEGQNYILTLTNEEYQPQQSTLCDLYTGVYYSSQNKKRVWLYEYENAGTEMIIEIEDNETVSTNNPLNYFTIIDKTHIQVNGITYELLEKGEFK